MGNPIREKWQTLLNKAYNGKCDRLHKWLLTVLEIGVDSIH